MEPNLRADRFAVLTAPGTCFECSTPMSMSALLVPAFRLRDGDEWMEIEDSAVLPQVVPADESAVAAWTARAPHVRPAGSKTAGVTYLANVCTCGALQGD